MATDPDQPTSRLETPEAPPGAGARRPLFGRREGPYALVPIPGNAELVVYLLVEILFAILWAATDAVDADDFVAATAVVTAAYLLSRGIAKASRVYER